MNTQIEQQIFEMMQNLNKSHINEQTSTQYNNEDIDINTAMKSVISNIPIVFSKSTTKYFNSKELDDEQDRINKNTQIAEQCLIVLNHEIQVNGTNDPITLQARTFYQLLQIELCLQTTLNDAQRNLFNAENEVDVMINQQGRCDDSQFYHDVRYNLKKIPQNIREYVNKIKGPLSENTKILQLSNPSENDNKLSQKIANLNKLKPEYHKCNFAWFAANQEADLACDVLKELITNHHMIPQYLQPNLYKVDTFTMIQYRFVQLYEQIHKPLIDQTKRHQEQMQKQVKQMQTQLKNKQSRELYQQRKLQETFNRANKQSQNEILQIVAQPVQNILKDNYKPISIIKIQILSSDLFIDPNTFPLYLDIQQLIFKTNANKIKKGFEQVFKINCPQTLTYLEEIYKLQPGTYQYPITDIYHMISGISIVKQAIFVLISQQSAQCSKFADKQVFFIIVDISFAILRIIEIRIRELQMNAFKNEIEQVVNHQSATYLMFQSLSYIKTQVFSSTQLNIEIKQQLHPVFKYLNEALDSAILII